MCNLFYYACNKRFIITELSSKRSNRHVVLNGSKVTPKRRGLLVVVGHNSLQLFTYLEALLPGLVLQLHNLPGRVLVLILADSAAVRCNSFTSRETVV